MTGHDRVSGFTRDVWPPIWIEPVYRVTGSAKRKP
jgi:hypothetical protein